MTVTKHAPPLSESDLRSWYVERLDEMSRESGSDGYCGNWNSCSGLQVVTAPGGAVLDGEKALALLEARAYKRGPVLAIRVGDFTKAFPASAVDKELVRRLAEARLTAKHFDWHILDRAQQAKSKSKTCGHCESSINVRKMDKPSKVEFFKASSLAGFDLPNFLVLRGVYMMTQLRGLTSCPVCGHELLKTDTDRKSEESLKRRISELGAKLSAAKAAYEAKQAGKPSAYWLLLGDCGS